MSQWIISTQHSFYSQFPNFVKKWHLKVQSDDVAGLLLLDDFDNSLARSGRLLVQNRNTYSLYHRDSVVSFTHRTQWQFVDNLPDSDVKKTLKKSVGVRMVSEVCRFTVHEAHYSLCNTDQKTLAKIQVLRTGDTRVISATPIKGYEKVIKKLSQALAEMGATEYTANPTEVMLTLSGFIPSEYSLKPKFNLSSDMTTRQAVAKIGLLMLQTARVNEPGIIQAIEDTEFLHDYRVCLRKVRSLVNLLKDSFVVEDYQEIKQRLSGLASNTNRLRDLDVYLLKKDSYYDRLPEPLRGGLPVMFADFTRQQSRCRRELKKWFVSEEYAQEMDWLIQRFESLQALPETEIATQSIDRWVLKKARKNFKKIGHMGTLITPDTPDEDVHELRILCKKFRYLLDMFSVLFDQDKLAQFTKRLRRLQNTLGKFNDYSVQQAALIHYLESKDRSSELATSVGALVMMLSQAQLAERQKVEIRFAEFYDAETQSLALDLFSKDRVL